MLSPFFFRRIDPGTCPGLEPGCESRVLGGGTLGGTQVGYGVIGEVPNDRTPRAWEVGLKSGGVMVAAPPFFEIGIEDDDTAVALPDVVEDRECFGGVLALLG